MFPRLLAINWRKGSKGGHFCWSCRPKTHIQTFFVLFCIVKTRAVGLLQKKLDYCFDLMADERVSSESRRAISWLLWAIWKNMNAIIFANTRDSVRRRVLFAMEEAKLWKGLNRARNSPLNCPSALVLARSWSPPLQSQVKCNIHANWRNNKLHCGGSWITRDYQGRSQPSCTRSFYLFSGQIHGRAKSFVMGFTEFERPTCSRSGNWL